jgi:hypothetical protein
MYVCMYVCVYVCMHVCMHVRVCMYVCVYVCVYVMYVCNKNIWISTFCRNLLSPSSRYACLEDGGSKFLGGVGTCPRES